MPAITTEHERKARERVDGACLFVCFVCLLALLVPVPG